MQRRNKKLFSTVNFQNAFNKNLNTRSCLLTIFKINVSKRLQ